MLFSDFLIKYLNGTYTSSDEIKCECPNCKQLGKKYWKAKLYVNIEKQTTHCFVCGYSKAFYNFKKDLKFKYGFSEIDQVDFIKHYKNPIENKKIVEKNAIEFEKGIVRLDLNKSDFFKPYIDYIIKRGFTTDYINYYNIHVGISGKYMNCIVIPVYMNNKLVYYVGRNIYKKQYINPKLEKTNIIFNYDIIKYRNTIYIVEGIFDAMKIGFDSIALLGKEISDHQIDLLYKLNNLEHVKIILDYDAIKYSKKMVEKFKYYNLKYNKKIKITNIELPDNKDPGDYSLEEINKIKGL